MFQIPKVFSTPYMAGPTLVGTPAGCNIYTPQSGVCLCGCGRPGCTCSGSGGANPKCVDGGYSPGSDGCAEIFGVGVGFAGAAIGAAIAADSFPGPAIPG